jgi:TRAP transporter 4TM/12TM fusion protein
MVTFLKNQMSSTGEKKEDAGLMDKIVSIFAILVALYHIYVFTVGVHVYDPFVHRSIHAGSVLALCFLTRSLSPRKTKKLPLTDCFLALLTLFIMAYMTMNAFNLLYERQPLSPGSLTAYEVLMGVAFILLLLEGSRRIIGPILGLLIVLFLIYSYIGPHLGGRLYHRGFSFSQIVDFTVFSLDGVFSIPVGVSATYIVMFLIFASFIQVSGAGAFFIDLAYAVAGKARGGPAKVAVISSGFMGSISGSAGANLVTTGAITIPMMKKAGFKPHMAGAIEAAASTGGHIMPPVMAGVIFLMSEITGIPYIEIVFASAVPALLYFLGVGMQVHFYAVRHGIGGGGSDTEIPSVWRTLKEGWQFLLPFISIVWLLVAGYSPIRAALWSTPVIILVSWFRKETRIGIKEVLRALESSIMSLRVVFVAMALSGILMGVVFYTGIGDKLVSMIRHLAGGMMFPALLLTAVVALILGLPLSMSASYLLVLILIIPAALKLGILPIAAHLFAIYFASVAGITPPTGGLFFMASALAGSPHPFLTGWTATRLAFAGFIVPFLFAYRPALLLIGNLTEIVSVIGLSIIGIIFLAAAAEGWFLRSLNPLERILLILGSFLLVLGDLIHIVGGVVFVGAVLVWQWLKAKSHRTGEVL